MSRAETTDVLPAAASPRSRRRAALIGGLALLAGLAAAALGLALGLGWALRTPSGAAWLLSHAPGVTLTSPHGTLLGDFDAQRVRIAMPGDTGTLQLDGLRWRGLRFERAGGVQWGRLVVDELSVERAEWLSGTPSATPLAVPGSLRLPLALWVRRLHVAELHAAALGAQPIRALKSELHLGADGGAQHRLDGLALAWGALRASAQARIATDAPFGLDAAAAFTREVGADAGVWAAQASLAGPLAAPRLQATLRARAGGALGVEQSLDAVASLQPFAAWPLGDLQARTRALDLSALQREAPRTALDIDAVARSSGLDRPAAMTLTLANTGAGRWDEGRLPLRRLELRVQARPDDPRTLAIETFDAELGSAAQAGGRIQGRGSLKRERWALQATMEGVVPSQLDARAAALKLGGTVEASTAGFDAPTGVARAFDLRAALRGRFTANRAAPAGAEATLAFDASVQADRIELRAAELASGTARATASGTATRGAGATGWSARGRAALRDFDPLPWWPGRDDSPWRQGPHRLNAQAEFELDGLAAGAGRSLADVASHLRGNAALQIGESRLAGLPLSGSATLRGAANGLLQVQGALDLAGNALQLEGRVATVGDGHQDAWTAAITAPAIARLAPLARLAGLTGGDPAWSGALTASARIGGRWPALTSEGQLEASDMRIGRASVQGAQARWQLGSAADAPLSLALRANQLGIDERLAESLLLQVSGTGRAHRIELGATVRALPPAWVDTLQAGVSGASVVPATGSVARMQAQGGLVEVAGQTAGGWRGTLQQLELGSDAAAGRPWLRSGDVALQLQWAGAAPQLNLQPGRAELLGAALRWSRMTWQAGAGATPAQFDALVELEPIAAAPLLARLQPGFGWGGDLSIGGRAELRSAGGVLADVVLERTRGDLSVTDETGTQPLGLTDLRLALSARDGVWTFTQGLAGTTLGAAAGAWVARTPSSAAWPSAQTPIEGVLELQVGKLATWGPWVPSGWRLDGQLGVSASIGGRLGAPEYTGSVRGSGISVRNFLQGVNVREGEVAIALRGTSARIERFDARAGDGRITLAGEASLGEAPQASLALTAERFQLLGRIDRRIVATGQAQLQLTRGALTLDGRFGIDEGLIDFSRGDAPSLADDVVVQRDVKKGPAPAASAPAAPTLGLAAPRSVALNLTVGLGERLRLRGRGLDTGLRGELKLTSPGNRIALSGTVRTDSGTYAAYGQKLTIDRGLLSFNGPAENPRLDIEATRPNLDVRVGVSVSGTALNPRVRLFSEPELPEIDKLSWLVLGRASDGLGRTDTALLQRAAVALLSGEGERGTDPLTRAIGLDDVSLRQTDGEVRETVISLGKQLSRRWYVGYERSLNATAGTWQLVYRVAQRFTLRAQSGEDNSLDLIWTWRWQ